MKTLKHYGDDVERAIAAGDVRGLQQMARLGSGPETWCACIGPTAETCPCQRTYDAIARRLDIDALKRGEIKRSIQS